MRAKLWFALTLLVATLAVAVGCGSSNTPATSSPSASSSPPPAISSPVSAVAATPAPNRPQSGKPSLQWFGQSMFLLTSSQGTRILMDPFNEAQGYALPRLSGIDAVIVTHEHPDHNNVALAGPGVQVIRGLENNEWAKVDTKVKDVSIRTLPAFHDDKQGAQRGKTAIFVFDVDGVRVVHLGDLGHTLNSEVINALKPVDILLIPVGGYYTIDGTTAGDVLKQIAPRVAVPMHFKTARTPANWPGSNADDFLKGKKVVHLQSNVLTGSKADLPTETTVYVLNYE